MILNALLSCRPIAAIAAVTFLTFGVLGCDTKNTTTSGESAPGAPASGKKLVVGFSQIGAESAWRTANTDSIRSEAEKRGIDLKFSDAQQKQENQIQAIRSFITQGVDVVVFSPVVKTGWEPVLREAKEAEIPVIVCDRAVEVKDESLVTAFIGFDSAEQGRAAGRWLIEKTGGKAVIVELQGTPGSEPAIERKKGFDEAIASKPDMKVIKSQTGEFTRLKGREVMESFLKSPDGPSITALYAHNDDMALGAIEAIEAAGMKPGSQITIVSIDSVKDAFNAMVAGKLNCTVECTPIIGPQVFDLVDKVVKKEKFDKTFLIKPNTYPAEKAAELLPTRKY